MMGVGLGGLIMTTGFLVWLRDLGFLVGMKFSGGLMISASEVANKVGLVAFLLYRNWTQFRALTAVVLYRYNGIFLTFNHKKSSCSSGAKSFSYSAHLSLDVHCSSHVKKKKNFLLLSLSSLIK